MNDNPQIEWIDQAEPVDRILRQVAILAVQRLGGDVIFERDEWNDLKSTLGGEATLHVVGSDERVHVVVTTQAQVAQNPFMAPRREN